MKPMCAVLVCLSLVGPALAQDAPGTITSLPISAGVFEVDRSGNMYGPRVVYLSGGGARTFLGGDPLMMTDFGDGRKADSFGFVRRTSAIDGMTDSLAPGGIVVDLDGTIYIAASFDQRVRRIDPDGIIWTAAGSSVREFPTPGIPVNEILRGAGFSGDGGPATQAQLNKPADVALDAQGNLYIADCANGRIRLVNQEGYISTFAGNGAGQTSPPGDGGPAILATLFAPVSVAVDLRGTIYVAEPYANRVRRIAPGPPHTITTLAGTGQAGFSGDGGPATQARLNSPRSVAVDVAGNVYIADYQNFRIRMVDPNGIITTVAGNGLANNVGPLGDGGPATQARIEYPQGVYVDARGYMYIYSRALQSIPLRRVTPLKIFEIPSIRLSASSVSFVAVNADLPVEKTFTVSNTSKETPLLVKVATRPASAFQVISQASFPVEPGGSQPVTVRYTPTSSRSTPDTLYVYHSGVEGNPVKVTLSVITGSDRSADFDGDGKVGLDDFFLFAEAFGQSGTWGNAKYDLDGSGKVDFDDFFLFAGKFGR